MNEETQNKTHNSRAITSTHSIKYYIERKSNIINSAINVLANSAIIIDDITDEELKKENSERAKYLAENLGIKKPISLNERTLLMFLLMTQDHDDREMFNLTLNEKTIRAILPDSLEISGGFRRVMSDIARSFMENTFIYYKDNEIVESVIVSSAANITFDTNKDVKIKLNPELKEHFANFNNQKFTQISFANVMKLKEKSKPLYLHLKKLDGYFNSKKAPGSDITLTKKELLNFYNSKSKNFNIFKNRTIDEAIKDINKNSDCIVSFRKLKTIEKLQQNEKDRLVNKEYALTIISKNKMGAKSKLLKAKDLIVGKNIVLAEGEFEIIDFVLDPVTAGFVNVSLKTKEGIEFSRTKSIDEMNENFADIVNESEDRPAGYEFVAKR